MPKAFLLTNKRYKIWKQIKETFREEQRKRQLLEQQALREQSIEKNHQHAYHHQHHQRHHLPSSHPQQHHEYYSQPVHHTDLPKDRTLPAHVIPATDYSQYTNITDEDSATNPRIPSPAVSPTSSTSSTQSHGSASEESDGGYSYTNEVRPISPSIEFGLGCRQPNISFLYDLMTSNHVTTTTAAVFKQATDLSSCIDAERYGVVQDLSIHGQTFSPLRGMVVRQETPSAGLVVTDESMESHVCVDCGKRYSTSSNLARHRQTHRASNDKKARKCPHCEKMYVSMPAYSMHVRTHNQGCECKYCGKRFSRPWLLQGHIRTHTGEKPFSCAQCGKSFADKSNLRAHIQTHSSEKPYVCGRCGKAFALKSYLYKHEESSCMRGQRFKE